MVAAEVRVAILLACPVAVLALGFAAPLARATAAPGPNPLRCRDAWNAPSNAANQLRLHRLGSGVVILDAGKMGKDSVGPGAATSSTESPACVILFIKGSKARAIDGIWSNGTVLSWTFGPEVPMQGYVPRVGNVRVSSSGRLSTI